MTDICQVSEQLVAEMMETVESYLDLSRPEDRARIALLMASKLVEVAAYHAVRVDPDAPRLQLFDLVGDLNDATDKICGRRTT
ncbi:MAG: hypothetical protein AAGE03_10305 [Pseudomonadota bacterium]